jgi:murein DD-endopeptidase MepM/ murein hydrolase activator NlpD
MNQQQKGILWVGIFAVLIFLFTDKTFRDKLFGRGTYLTAAIGQPGGAKLPYSLASIEQELASITASVPGVSTITGTSSGGSTAVNASGYADPIGSGLTSERIDMGVDYGGSGPLYALGSGVITNLTNSGWPGGGFIGLHLTSGAYAGDYVYYAEDVAPTVNVGQTVKAGQQIGTATGGSSGIEIGWAAAPGTGETMAAASGQDLAGLAKGDPGFYPTAYGLSFSNLIKALGGQPGVLTGAVQGTTGSAG